MARLSPLYWQVKQLRGLMMNDDNSPKQSQTPKQTEVIAELTLAKRFRGFMPVVVDVETAGLNPQTDALLEIAFVPILMNDEGSLYQASSFDAHLVPFVGANIEENALKFTGIKLNSPLRQAIAENEKIALQRIFKALKLLKKEHSCRQCILVGHNAHFDLSFLNAAIIRNNLKNQSPFHAFSVIDTASLSALAFGHTVLARTCQMAGIDFDNDAAHSALYDTKKTAELFCYIVNQLPMLVKSPKTNT